MLQRLTALFAAAVIVATAVFWLFAEIDRRSAPDIVISAPRNNEPIVVEIAGAVTAPGVYTLRDGDRVFEVIEAAGGLLPDADTSGLNQAALLIDGQRVTVPTSATAASSVVTAPDASPEPLLININTASVEEFDQLPGIGHVKATAIVEYRNQHGPFQSLEELLFVDGISERLLEEIRPFVTLAP